MSTNSTITIKTGGIYKTIYCHWDGYLDGVGKMLRENYRNKEAILELLNLGELSSLGHDTSGCVAYCRDRGEDMLEALKSLTYEECRKEEYNYLWVHGQWWVGNTERSITELSKAKEEEDYE